METIERLLRRAWWRLVAIDLLRTLAVTLSLAAFALILLRLTQSLYFLPASWPQLAGLAAELALVAALAWSLVRTRRGHAVARRVDERAGLRETLSTALCVNAQDDPWSKATVELAGRAAATVNLRAALPVEAPRLWPAPLAAWALLAILLAVPVLNLPGLTGTPLPPPFPQQQAQEVSAEVEQMKTELLAEAARLGVIIDLADNAAPDALAPTDLTPEEIQANAVKELTKLTDSLDAQMQERGADTLEALEKQLERLRQPGPGPAQDLARALARGDFDMARKELSKLAEQLNSNELSPEQQQELEKQIANLADQLKKLAEQNKELERSLRQAGLSPENAARLAADPEAISKALEQMKNLTEEQKKQLMQQAKAQAEACQQCNNMSQSMSKLAKAMSGANGMSGQAQLAMDEMSDMLSEMEMLDSDLSAMKAMRSKASAKCNSIGKNFDRGADGNIGPGIGSNHATSEGTPADESSFALKPTQSTIDNTGGPIIGSRLVYEGQIRGESRAAFAQSAAAAAATASDAVESMQVPREYEAAVLRYFGALKDKSEPATDAAPTEK